MPDAQQVNPDIPVSVYMLTFNNARTVETALRCVAGWADEIVVVDSHSTDETPEIAQRYATTFIQRPWPGFREQYQFAADQCRNDWALFIDADEEIPKTMLDEIDRELDANQKRPADKRIAGYQCNRITWFLGRWIQHGGWLPDHEIRLHDRNRGGWKGGLHAKVHVAGPEAFLENVFLHYTYADIADQIRTINKYSDNAAQDMLEEGRSSTALHLIFRPLGRFLRDYVFKRGFLDGRAGFVIAVNTAFHVFSKYAKLWELRNAPQGNAEPPART